MSIGPKLGRLAGLILVTFFSGAVMLASGLGFWTGESDQPAERPTVEELPPAPVSIQHARPQQIAITDTYSGMLKPWERFRIGFDINGRVVSLGENQLGQPLDDGDVVRVGQVLATLDSRHLAARQREAKAMRVRAEDEFERAQELAQVNERAIRQGTLLTRETEFEVAQAQEELAAKALEDATLTAKVDGVISRRMINIGEPVLPQQTAFEIVQVDRLLLSIGVPESRVRAMIDRQRDVARQREIGRDVEFGVKVQLSGRDAMGRPLDAEDGTVRTIAQTSDQDSGLFEVEIEIENSDRLLRPGQIGVARLEIAEVEGYRVPNTAAVVRNDSLALFFARREKDVAGAMPAPADGDRLLAKLMWLEEGDYLEQGSDIILLKLPPEARNVVTRGQHRLVDGSPIVAAQVLDTSSGTSSRTNAAEDPSNDSSQ